MRHILATCTAAACCVSPLPVAAQGSGAAVSLEHRMLLRCSAAFALVAKGQQAGKAGAGRYPPLGERGREFFVRSAATVMDRAKLDRTQINDMLHNEARDLVTNGTLGEIMPVCLEALEKSGL